MIVLDKNTVPIIDQGRFVLEFRVYNNSTFLYEWRDFTSRLKDFSAAEVVVDRSLSALSFESVLSSITVRNDDRYFDALISEDLGLFNDSEPYIKRLRGRRVRIGREIIYADGTTRMVYLGVGAIEDYTASNTSPYMTFTLQSLSRLAMEQRGDAEKVNGFTIYGTWGDPATSTHLYRNRETEAESETVKRTWFEHRRMRDILKIICNCLQDVDTDISEVKMDIGTLDRVCSIVNRPPDPPYSSGGENYCRAIAWDEGSELLWLGMDDYTNPGGSAFLFQYDPDTNTYLKIATVYGGGRIQKLWWNSQDSTVVFLVHEDVDYGHNTRGIDAYLFKESTSLPAGSSLYCGSDELVHFTDYNPNTFCHRDGVYTKMAGGGDQMPPMYGWVAGCDEVSEIGNMGRHVWWPAMVGTNCYIPYVQRVAYSCLPGSGYYRWDMGGFKCDKTSGIVNTPNLHSTPRGTYTFFGRPAITPVRLGPCFTAFKSIYFPQFQEGPIMWPQVWHSLGQAGTTCFHQAGDGGNGVVFLGTYDNTNHRHNLASVRLSDGAVTPINVQWRHTINPLCAFTSNTDIYVSIMEYNETLKRSGYTECQGWLFRWDGSGLTEVGSAPGKVILEGTGDYDFYTGKMMCCVLDVTNGLYDLSLVPTYLGGARYITQRDVLLGLGHGSSGKNAFRGFTLCNTGWPYMGDGRVYFYETGVNLLWSWKHSEGIARRNVAGGTQFPIVEGETNQSCNLVMARKFPEDWVIYGISSRQWMDQDGGIDDVTPYDPAAQYVLWQYAKKFEGFIPLCDFTDLTLHDIRNLFAQFVNGVHWYGPDGTWHFKERPSDYGTPAVLIDNLAEGKLQTAGYKSVVNHMEGIPWAVVFEPKPCSSPWSRKSGGSTGELARLDIKGMGSEVVEWRIDFLDSVNFLVYYRLTATDPTTWSLASTPSGNINTDYRGSGEGDCITIPSGSWSGSFLGSDQFGFFVYPMEKRLEQLSDREAIVFTDNTSAEKYGRIEQQMDNRFIPRILYSAVLENLVTFWMVPRPIYQLTKVPLNDDITPLTVVQWKDDFLGGYYGSIVGFINRVTQRLDDPMMDLELMTDETQVRGGGGGGS